MIKRNKASKKAAYWRTPAPAKHIVPTQAQVAAAATREYEHPDVHSVLIGGRKFHMSLQFKDLLMGERRVNAGRKETEMINALEILSSPGRISSIRTIFAISLYRFHPEISFTEAKLLLTLGTIIPVAEIIFSALSPKELPEPLPKNKAHL